MMITTGWKACLLLVLAGLVATLQGSEPPVVSTGIQAPSDSAAQDFKDSVLAMCLAEAYRHDPRPARDVQASLSLLVRRAGYDSARVEHVLRPLVDAYVQRDYFNPLAESEVRGVRFDLLKCLDLYHAPVLDALWRKLETDISH